jgi:hypothetical protein
MTALNTADILSGATPLERIEAWESARTPNAARLRNVVEAATIFNKAISGNPLAQFELREAFSTSDFPILLGSAFEIEMLARYEGLPAVWDQWCTRTLVKDFKPKKFVDFFGGRRRFDRVAEGAEYKGRDRDEAEYFIKAGKFGNTFDLTFELIKNAEYDTLASLPDDLAAGARETEEYEATEMLVNKDGINTDFFKAGNSNAPTNLPLTRANVKLALKALAKRKGPDGKTINLASGVNLLVPTSLALEAEEIVTAERVRVKNADGTEETDIRNSISGKVTPIVIPTLEEIDESATAATTWFLAPKKDAARPAFVVAFMRGQENPDIRVQADTGNRVGGGAIAPEEGSFNDDTVKYRGRHIVGAATLAHQHTYASRGA